MLRGESDSPGNPGTAATKVVVDTGGDPDQEIRLSRQSSDQDLVRLVDRELEVWMTLIGL